jgi:hypothetical protein
MMNKSYLHLYLYYKGVQYRMTKDYRIPNAPLTTLRVFNNLPEIEFFLVISEYRISKIERNHQIDPQILSREGVDQYQFNSVSGPCPAGVSTYNLVNCDRLIFSGI